MLIKCKYEKLVPIAEIKPHPKNRNLHNEDQITRLAQIFEYQGIRHPIIISKLSGFIVAGHGRLAAAQKLGYTEFPVDYQEFSSEDQEYAFLVSDNSIALWSELDLTGINNDLTELNTDFDLDNLGLKNFNIESQDGDFDMEEFNEEFKNSFVIEVTFPNDMEMNDVKDELLNRGFIVKVK